ncbi:ParB/RepB/Spo0J family partition protein [Sphingomonas sp.]|uniref:ParB/RepB/Spo0J family partition protein n=1 Tax=Sphingomonas sp. TaxID=28214 RepID=UPI003B00D2EE
MSDDNPLARRRAGGLGRGLSALLGDVERDAPRAAESATPADGDVRMIAVADIRVHPQQPRRYFDEDALDELARSIEVRGVLQPIVVRQTEAGFEIVAGERRWRAAQRAHLHELPALVRTLDDRSAFEVAIIENVQRADLNAIEEAEAYRRLISDHGRSPEEVGRFVGKSRSHVANLLRLLDLPSSVRASVASGALSMGHARAVAASGDPERLAEEVLRRGLSVRDAERLARSEKGRSTSTRERGGAGTPAELAPDADITALGRQLADMLGLAVEIGHSQSGGTVTLHYSSLDQLDMICQRLSGERF